MATGRPSLSMSELPRTTTEEELLDAVRRWVEVLASEDYESVFESLGYAMRYERPGANAIRDDIARYRSTRYFPGVEQFKVSNWRTAKAGNPSPIARVTWYRPNATGLVAAVDFDLPLNGKWSDLTANFVLFNADGDCYSLSLEDISSPGDGQAQGVA